MRYPNILVIGGTGFIGQRLISRLSGAHHRVVVPTRKLRHGRDLLPLPTVDIVEADVYDEAALGPLIEAADAVVNLVGVLHSSPAAEGQDYGAEFARAHVELPRMIAAHCAQTQTRLLHVSALGADPARTQLPSGYLRSKTDGEKAIADSGLTDYTIMRPSVVFGPGDSFLNLFAKLQRFSR